MSAQDLIIIMDKLLKIHTSLYEIAIKKTDVIKLNDMNSLNQILKEEQSHIAAIRDLERERQRTVQLLCPIKNNPTISDCIEYVVGTDKDELINISNCLMEVVNKLKEANDLNHQLLQHSLHFINVSLNLLRPQSQSLNYSPSKVKTNAQVHSEGLFNTKA
ncbi:flagellar protein FlgN [Bacillaceae bacterium CLA-AA-H227]|uniref:Flagellar protein FlgN n=1 Tax=Robertmurraya yapensis (ex Hitch et al 2024) TaxID=3133160 RepID=A0ACC6SBY6_9BACI